MVDVYALQQILSLKNAAWAAVALLALFILRMWNGAPAVFAQWVAWRHSVAEAKAAERRQAAEEKAADWTRLREEIARLSESEKQCRRDYDALHKQLIETEQKFIKVEQTHAEQVSELRAEIAELRGYLVGQGKAAQEAAGIVAMERSRRRKGDGPEHPNDEA